MDPSTLRETSDRLDVLLRGLDALSDPVVRDRVREIVALLMGLHHAGLERVMALASDSLLGGPALSSRLADDPIVGPLLLVHDVHPYPADVRLARALDRLRPRIAAHGCRATLVGIDEQTARVRLEGGARLSDRSKLGQVIQTCLLDAAPELAAVTVEPVDAEPARSSPVPLIQIVKHPRPGHCDF